MRAGFDASLNLDWMAFTTSVAAPQLEWSVGDGNLTSQWAGAGFELQSEINALPVGLGTNWMDYPDGDAAPVVVPVDSTLGTAFFRLTTQ